MNILSIFIVRGSLPSLQSSHMPTCSIMPSPSTNMQPRMARPSNGGHVRISTPCHIVCGKICPNQGGDWVLEVPADRVLGTCFGGTHGYVDRNRQVPAYCRQYPQTRVLILAKFFFDIRGQTTTKTHSNTGPYIV